MSRARGVTDVHAAGDFSLRNRRLTDDRWVLAWDSAACENATLKCAYFGKAFIAKIRIVRRLQFAHSGKFRQASGFFGHAASPITSEVDSTISEVTVARRFLICEPCTRTVA